MPRPDPSNIYHTAPSSPAHTPEVPGIPVFLNRRVQRRNGLLTGGVLALALLVLGGVIALVSKRLAVQEQNTLPNVPEGPLTTLPGLNSNDLQQVQQRTLAREGLAGSGPTNQIITLLEIRVPPPEPLGLAQALAQAQEQSAARALDLAPRLDENSVPFLMTRIARQLYDRGEYDEAANHLARALDREPAFTEARELLAAIYLAQRNYPQAAAAYADLIQRSPFVARYYNNLALAQLRMEGDSVPAERNLREAIRLEPGYGDAKVNLGLVVFRRKDYRETLRILREIQFGYRDHPGVRYALGVSLLETGAYAEARGHLEELSRLLPERGDVFVLVARAFAAESRIPLALSWLRMARNVSLPQDYAAWVAHTDFEPLRENAAFLKLLE